MALKDDYRGEEITMPPKESAGQSYGTAQTAKTEQIASLGGFAKAEKEVNESEDKPVTIKSPTMQVDI